ncbi:aminotransferase class III-fold pyridoxal phosphate-dependent enzyme [Corallococcus praedator]|uniref:Aminotransferase class III-fold pyridoxal phosphate-dependent enzyme n=1 Tax=Corallococcus praedator TaxID=2316724 RepID=A0ABX9QIX3_9BACT|nr:MULTISPECIES: aminotransferase class III-fold pyridoxal phosphate-dependent enzyme [Corallococcus]RKH29407.1 aminotransferase class III-fold pyridoxal phosphate-dependent enzyme [Corallococcus sp. CA031C]RKI08670.1 aminotransferase class III-fold pyridoxal phosphate-dependent enzyme [Corallococcus praedator]
MKVPAAGEKLGADDVARLRAGMALQMDHYGGGRLPYVCLKAKGLVQHMATLEGPDAGRVVEVLDASGGYASACLGAGHPRMQEALRDGLERAGYVTDELGSLERTLLLEELFGAKGLWADRFPGDAYHASGRNSGSEGLELALRLVLESNFDRRRMAPKPERSERRTILAFEGAWHGWTQGLVSLLNRRHYRLGMPLPATEALDVQFLPFGELSHLETFFAEHGRKLAGVFVEPIQGDAGILVPPPGYLRRLAALCREHDVLLVADEVLTFAKTGRFFGMTDAEGPIPTDITVIGKSLGMGVVSTSMVIARRELSVRSSGAVSTSDLRPLTSAVMRSGIQYMSGEGLVERTGPLGELLRERLRKDVAQPFPEVFQEVRGLGYMNGLELTEKASGNLGRLRTRLLDSGIFVEFMAGAGRRSRGLRYLFPAMRIAPPLIAGEADLQEMVARIQRGVRTFVESGS